MHMVTTKGHPRTLAPNGELITGLGTGPPLGPISRPSGLVDADRCPLWGQNRKSAFVIARSALPPISDIVRGQVVV